MGPIAWTNYFPFGGTGSLEQPLQFEGREDIGVLSVSIFGQQCRVKKIKARSDDYRCNTAGQAPFGHVEIDTVWLTHFEAAVAWKVVGRFVGTVLDVYGIGSRLCLLEGCIDGLSNRHPNIEFVLQDLRAGEYTLVTSCTLAGDIARLLADCNIEAPRLALDFDDFG